MTDTARRPAAKMKRVPGTRFMHGMARRVRFERRPCADFRLKSMHGEPFRSAEPYTVGSKQPG